MKKGFTLLILGFILLSLFAISFVNAIGYQLICLRQGEKIEFSKCNPDIQDKVCDNGICQLCTNEISAGVYCPTNTDLCNDLTGGCTYLYEEPLPPPVDVSVITLVGPVNDYSQDSGKLTFSYKLTKSSELQKCELIINGNSVASKSPGSTTQTITYNLTNPGDYKWKIKCTQRSTYGGNLIFSEQRDLKINDPSVSNVGEITLVSPVNSYSASGAQEISFVFSISGDLTKISQCNLNLDSESIPLSEIKSENTIAKSVVVGSHSWEVKCVDTSQKTISSNSRTFTISEPAPAGGNTGGGSSGGSRGGSGGGGGGSTVYTLTQTQLTDGTTKDMTKGAKFSFKIANVTHSATVNNITTKSASITVSSTPQTFTLNIGEEKKVDINNDNTYDLSIKLNNITSNKASVTIKGISEIILGKTSSSETEDKTETTTSSNTENQSSIAGITGNVVGFAKNNKIPVALGFVIVVAVLGLISYNVRKKDTKD